MKNNMFKKTLILIFIVSLLLPVFYVNAQDAGIIPTPTGDKEQEGDYTLDDFIQLAVNISEWILGIVGSLALLMFVYGGVVWIFSAGNTEMISKGKNIIIGAVIGLVLVFSAYTIIQFSLNAIGFEGASNWFTLGE